MAKFNRSVAVGFGLQTGEGSGFYNGVLNGIGATWDGIPDGVDQGLVLGNNEGIANSGLTSMTFGRNRTIRAFTNPSFFTRPFADLNFLAVTGFTFSFPLVGSRRTTSGPPVDADFLPLVGVRAIYASAGLDTNDRPGGPVGQSIKFDHQAGTDAEFPISALIYFHGNRVELLDVRCSSLAFSCPPGEVGKVTGQFEVGSVLDPAAKGFAVASPLIPVLDYGTQATVSSPAVKGVAHAWNATRGFSEMTITIAPAVQDIQDSNAPTGFVKEADDRVTTIEATVFVDDAGSGEVFELDQLLATVAGDLKQLSFTVGTPEVSGALPAVATQFVAAQPEVTEMEPAPPGQRAGVKFSAVLGHATTGGGEFEIILE